MRAILGPALAAAVAHAVLLGVYLAAHHGDPSALLCAALERIEKPPYETVHTGFPKMGYDGQFYYVLARAPWSAHTSGIDFAPGRHLRVLYPAIGWLVTGGDADRLLWALPAINLLAIAALAALGAALAGRRGLSPWWGCLLPLAVNAGLPALRDLTDVVATLAVCGLLLSWQWRRPVLELALWAAAAVFCREQNAAILSMALALAAWQRRWSAFAALGTVLALWAGWVMVLHQMYGCWPFLPGQRNFAAPLSAFRRCWPLGPHHEVTGNALAQAACMVFVAGQVLAALWLARPRASAASEPLLRLFLLAGVALALVAGTAIYEDKWSFMRVLSWLPLGLWLVCVEQQRRWALAVLALPVLLPLGVVAKAWAGG